MADWLASLPPAGWLFLLFLVAAIPVLLCSALLLMAFVPSGAGRAGWRNPVKLLEREGIASWSDLHPAYPLKTIAPKQMSGHADSAPRVRRTALRPTVRSALAQAVTQLQRARAQLMRSPLLPAPPSSQDSA